MYTRRIDIHALVVGVQLGCGAKDETTACPLQTDNVGMRSVEAANNLRDV
jgi:hypothetical protein